MEPLIAKNNLEKYLKHSQSDVFKVKEFIKMFDSLKQEKIVLRKTKLFEEDEESVFNTSFHFIDYRGVTLYIVHRTFGDRRLLIENLFDAPEIKKVAFFKMLPLNPENYLTGYFYKQRENTKLYYANEKIAFKLPILDILEYKGGLETIDIKLDIENDKAKINLISEEYAGLWHWYDRRFYNYEIKLSTFDIYLLEYRENRYKF